MEWTVSFHIFRYKQDGSDPHFDQFTLAVKPDEYVLDAVERIWAEKDRSLVFRHACHHAACGACGMRVNGQEKLTCITRIDSVVTNGGTVVVEPMRNLPVISDLVVDMTSFYEKMEQVQFVPVRSAEPIIDQSTQQPVPCNEPLVRYENCIECALCVSACPVTGTNETFLGPAALAALCRMLEEPRGEVDVPTLIGFADSENGLWCCHLAFECVEACPADVNPTRLMTDLRRQLIRDRIKEFFGIRNKSDEPRQIPI
jgi:succinate dehydrogenase / fumarate reductase, iron-sulfur subunit